MSPLVTDRQVLGWTSDSRIETAEEFRFGSLGQDQKVVPVDEDGVKGRSLRLMDCLGISRSHVGERFLEGPRLHRAVTSFGNTVPIALVCRETSVVVE